MNDMVIKNRLWLTRLRCSREYERARAETEAKNRRMWIIPIKTVQKLKSI